MPAVKFASALLALASAAAIAAPAHADAAPIIGQQIRMDWTGSYPKGIGTVTVTMQVSAATRVTVTMRGKTTKAKAAGSGSYRTWEGIFHNPAVTRYAAQPKPRTVKITACGSSGCTSATRTLYPPAVPPGAPGYNG